MGNLTLICSLKLKLPLTRHSDTTGKNVFASTPPHPQLFIHAKHSVKMRARGSARSQKLKAQLLKGDTHTHTQKKKGLCAIWW